jgi:hypothetical protein
VDHGAQREQQRDVEHQGDRGAELVREEREHLGEEEVPAARMQ